MPTKKELERKRQRQRYLAKKMWLTLHSALKYIADKNVVKREKYAANPEPKIIASKARYRANTAACKAASHVRYKANKAACKGAFHDRYSIVVCN